MLTTYCKQSTVLTNLKIHINFTNITYWHIYLLNIRTEGCAVIINEHNWIWMLKDNINFGQPLSSKNCSSNYLFVNLALLSKNNCQSCQCRQVEIKAVTDRMKNIWHCMITLAKLLISNILMDEFWVYGYYIHQVYLF